MSVIEVTKMPKASTLRKYYPESKLSDERLVELAEWLRNYLEHRHISADNHILAALIARSESALDGLSNKELVEIIKRWEQLIKNIEHPEEDLDPRTEQEEAFAAGIARGIKTCIELLREEAKANAEITEAD